MKIVRLLMALHAIVFIASPLLAEALSGSCGRNATYIIDTETGLLRIEGSGEMTEYDDSLHFTPWYSCRSIITKVEISKGITSIGNYAFNNCTGLISVSIPICVTSIGNGAFFCCTSLTSITIPKSVTSLGNDVFQGCSALTEIICKVKVPPTVEPDTFSES